MLARTVKIFRNHTISNFISSLEPTKIMLPVWSQCHQKRTNPFSNEQINILINVLGYDYQTTYRLMMKQRTLMDVDACQLKQCIELLHRFGVSMEDIREAPTVLTILPATIEQHGMVLQEGGFCRITAKLLVSYLNVVRKRLPILKAYGYIPANVNVSAVLLSHLEPEVPPLENYVEGEDTTYLEVFQTVLLHYLKWKLKFTPEELEKLPVRYKRLRHRSLCLIRRSLAILKNTLEFSNEKICKNGYLIHSHPENTLHSMQEVPTLGGVDIKTMFHRYPKLIMTATPTLVQTLKHLKEFGISDEAILNCPYVFTLSSATVYKRLLHIKDTPAFNALVEHPRILRLVYYQIKAQSRLMYFQGINFKCTSLHILSAPKPIFERYAREGVDRTRGVDVVNYMSNKLGATEIAIRNSIQRHQYWCNVPLVSIKETLDALLERGFKKKEIMHSIHILLYPWDLVMAELEVLPHRSELLDKHIVPYHHQLAQCLYFIERRHHFTGDGIWPLQEPPLSHTASDTPPDISSDTTSYATADTFSKLEGDCVFT